MSEFFEAHPAFKEAVAKARLEGGVERGLAMQERIDSTRLQTLREVAAAFDPMRAYLTEERFRFLFPEVEAALPLEKP